MIDGFKSVEIGSAIKVTDSLGDPSLDIVNHDMIFHVVTVPDDRAVLMTTLYQRFALIMTHMRVQPGMTESMWLSQLSVEVIVSTRLLTLATLWRGVLLML